MHRRHRIVAASDFRRVSRTGASVARPEFVLYYSPRAEGSPARFGFVVGRRIGGAVARNRVKRLLREAARTLLPRLETSVDVVVVAREPIRERAFPELELALHDCAARAGLTDRPKDESTTS